MRSRPRREPIAARSIPSLAVCTRSKCGWTNAGTVERNGGNNLNTWAQVKSFRYDMQASSVFYCPSERAVSPPTVLKLFKVVSMATAEHLTAYKSHLTYIGVVSHKVERPDLSGDAG